MAYPDGAASIFSKVTRITQLSALGTPAAGNSVYTTTALVKATPTPVLDTGVDIAIQNAAGDLAAWFKHGDMIKYATMSIELATPDPGLESLFGGGALLSDVSTALGTTTGCTVTGQTTLGTLAAGVRSYRVSQYNQYGESAAEAGVVVTNTGSTSSNVVSGITPATKALGLRVYAGAPGNEQYIGSVPNIGSQATSATSSTGSVAALTVTALTSPIPAGTTFQITGDTNTPKITWTVLTTAGVGATSLSVSPSQSVTTTIVAAAILPVYWDTGSVAPSGAFQTTDTTAGPGAYTGVAAPPVGPVGNPLGVGIEFFSVAVVNGQQAVTLPYFRWVFPLVTNLHVMPRDIAAANAQTIYEGQAFENPNFGTGPMNDWQFGSSRWWQRARCGAQMLPAAGVDAPLLALV